MRKNFVIVSGVLLMLSLACTFNVNLPGIGGQPGEKMTREISIDPPNNDLPAEISVAMGAGKLNIQGGGTKLVEGTIIYNVPQLEPIIKQEGNSVHLTQSGEEFNLGKSALSDYQNEWDLKLGSYPLNIELQAGAYEGKLDFSGVALTGLTINDGASRARVSFKTPNPAKIDLFSYKTGASEVHLEGLSDANFERMSFVGGAGSYTFDFSGSLQQNSWVEIESGMSSIEIILPEGINSKIILSGDLVDTSTQGDWRVVDNVYYTEGAGPLLSIEVDASVGSLKLVHQ